jgi:hypothetical protein
MEVRTSREMRRALVAVNYLSLLLFLLCYYLGVIRGWNLALQTSVLILLAVSLTSFIFVHMRTGLWRLAHAKQEELDERQIQVTHEALRYSYAIFTVSCLLIMGFNAITGHSGHYMFDIVLPVSFIYFAHSLPSSVLAWTEREV